MQVFTRKYGGDPMRTYKILMRKLNKEGHYQELKEKEFFKSKSQRKREDKVKGIARTKKKLRIINEQISRETYRKRITPSTTAKQKN